MEAFLANVGVQAMRYAIRSGIAVTSSYCANQCSRLLKTVNDKELARDFKTWQTRLENKINILAPALDLIELKSGRGNTLLEAAVPLAKSLHQEILRLAERVELTADLWQQLSCSKSKVSAREQAARTESIELLFNDIRILLDRIDREIPMLQLAITTSGEVLSTILPPSISPSRLLQASALLIMADSQHSHDPISTIQVGPTFNLSLYMLFLGHADRFQATAGESLSQGKTNAPLPEQRKPIWQEVVHKAQIRLCRAAKTPGSVKKSTSNCDAPDYTFYLDVCETKDDGRLRDEGHSDASRSVLVREVIPLKEISKLFYVDTRRILNINDIPSEENNPILLLKRELPSAEAQGPITRTEQTNARLPVAIHGESEQAEVDRQLERETSRLRNTELSDNADCDTALEGFPPYLDQQWVAFEMFEADIDLSDESSEGDTTSSECSSQDGVAGGDTTRITPTPVPPRVQGASRGIKTAPQQRVPLHGSSNPFQMITKSLSLLEMLIRLASLQELQQESHLSVPDHILTFFLEETSAGMSNKTNVKVRDEAQRRMGFDPYAGSSTQQVSISDRQSA